MTKQWLWLATPNGNGNLIHPEYAQLVLEVAQLPSGRLTARWRDVATGETSDACVAPEAGMMRHDFEVRRQAEAD